MQEFKTFAMRGNVVDLAVAVVLGASFGKIVTTLVEGIIMPVLGVVVSNVDFSQLKIVLKEAAGTQPEVAIKYGAFAQSVFDFLIIAFCIFLMVKGINKLSRQPSPGAAPAPTGEPKK